MPRRKQTPEPPKPPLRLLQPMDTVRGKIVERMEAGNKILELPISSWEELENTEQQYRKWTAYNDEMLRRLFSSGELASEYSWSAGFAVVGFERNLGHERQELHERIREQIHRLDSIAERLELIPLSDDVAVPSAVSIPVTLSTDRVFLVHGHDDAAREATARFLERLDLQAIILHEQANEGQTIIEKLETHSDVGYAVVLLTPDDEGRARNAEAVVKPRARQNVLLELGYFVGKLGRKRVCALYRGSVEVPSDFLGVLYVAFDDAGAWQMKLAKELKAGGFDIDTNRAV
ncbi:MAG: nucleotide-binding protein [Planctomycetota bacterium]